MTMVIADRSTVNQTQRILGQWSNTQIFVVKKTYWLERGLALLFVVAIWAMRISPGGTWPFPFLHPSFGILSNLLSKIIPLSEQGHMRSFPLLELKQTLWCPLNGSKNSSCAANKPREIPDLLKMFSRSSPPFRLSKVISNFVSACVWLA